MMKMEILSTLVLAKCFLMATEGLQYSRSSDLLHTYSCLEETSVIYIAYDMFTYSPRHANWLASLENPCTHISFFDHGSRKIVQWKGDKESNLEASFGKKLDKRIFEELLESFIDQDRSTKNILLIDVLDVLYYYETWTERMNDAIEKLEKNTKWSVILICILSVNCPTTTNIPVHRILPSGRLAHDQFTQIRVKDLVQNPDFNVFEFLKYVKIDNVNLTCLANKTVHILGGDIYNYALVEKIALIKFNTEKYTKAVKFIIYIGTKLDRLSVDKIKQFSTYYLKEKKLDHINIVVNEEIPTLTGDGVLFFEANYGYNLSSINYSTNSRNSVVFFDFDFEMNLKEAESLYTKQKTEFKKTVKMFSSKLYKTTHKFIENFIEDLLNASCF